MILAPVTDYMIIYKHKCIYRHRITDGDRGNTYTKILVWIYQHCCRVCKHSLKE